MPHQSVKLKPGLDQNETPALNEAGFSTSQLVRFIYDRNGLGLIQKLGGWVKYYPNQISIVVRALWAWADQNFVTRLAYGTQNSGSSSQLGVITDGTSQQIITPQSTTSNILPVVTTVANSSSVSITDTVVTGVTQYNSVFIETHISIGGLILFGLYPTTNLVASATIYQIVATDLFGNAKLAPSSSSSASVASFATTSGLNLVTVTLTGHGFAVGDSYPILVPTTVGGITLSGNYVVQTVPTANTFTINGPTIAAATASAPINGGLVRYQYSFGIGANPAGSGYGINAYGSGGYGTGSTISPSLGSAIPSYDWTLDNWGQVLLSCPINGDVTQSSSFSGSVSSTTLTAASVTGTITTGQVLTGGTAAGGTVILSQLTGATGGAGTYSVSISQTATCTGASTTNVAFQPIYQWDPSTGAVIATSLTGGPTVNDGMFVAMPQRQIVAWGSSFNGVQDPLLIRWCDVNNYGEWVADPTNQAGSYRITKGSKIVGAIQGPQQGLVWTDVDVWAMQYTGPPYIYSFNEIGTGCGLIGRKAAGAINGTVYWMGPSSFFTLSGNGVQPLTCPIWDVIFQDIDMTNTSKIRCAVNSRFGEISWYYPTKSSGGEVNAYAKFNVNLQVWDFGALARSAWIDQSVLGPPIGADPNLKYVYQHETSTDADGQPMLSSFQTGYFAISDGDMKSFIDQVWPDMKWGYYNGAQNATVNLTFYVADYAGQAPTTYGPYALTQNTTFVSPRFRGRLVSIAMSSNDIGSFWRIGNMRYRFQPDGKY